MQFNKMLKDINKLVENDFAFDMECKLLPGARPFTQKEAKEMADTISKVYSISHSIHCSACGKKYK